LLEPASFENKLIANKSDIPIKNVPKYRSELQMDRLGISLREDQFRQMVLISQRAKLFRVSIKYRRHKRPNDSVSKAPKQWWNFALRCVVGDIRERHSRWRWETMKQRRQDRLSYLDLWQKKLQKKGKALDKGDGDALRKLEEWLPYEDIIYFRSLSEVQFRRKEERDKALSPSKVSGDSYSSQISSWAGWATGWFKRPPHEESAHPTAPPGAHPEETTLFGVKLSEDDWSEIFSAVMMDESFAEADDEQSGKQRRADQPPPDWVRIEAALTLSAATIELRDDSNAPIASIALRSVVADVELRDSWKTFSAQLASLQIADPSSKDSLFPILVEPQFEYERRIASAAPCSAASSDQKLFKVKFDIDSQIPQVDYALELELAHMNIIYNYTFIRKVGAFFSSPYDAEAAEEQAQTRGWNLTSRRQQLLFLVERKSTFYVNLDINAPNILIPQDPTSKSSPMIVLVLGRAQMRTVLGQALREQDYAELPSHSQFDSSFYDVFNLHISNVQAIMAKTEKYDSALRSDSRALESRQLLQPFDFTIELAICKINVEQLANLRLRFALPSLRASLPSKRLRRFMNILFQVIWELTGPSAAVYASVCLFACCGRPCSRFPPTPP
jgi:vacuolar protein sorting-associated protein 13A/C